MAAAAAQCPILGHRDTLLAALESHDVIIVVGETGSGKTTQLPQMLVNAGYGRVVVTQPRRVAAIAAARRVATEMGSNVGGDVGYAVRFEHEVSDVTRITFVTDGVLLRQAVATPALSQYDALVLDEAHERSLNTDVLFALAKRALTSRRAALARGSAPAHGLQRVVVASATLDTEKLRRFFFDAPVLHVAGRCFPVEILHAAKPLSSDRLVEAALEVVLRIHSERPGSEGGEGGEGGVAEDVLVFCTGQEEISTAAQALRSLAAELSSSQPELPALLVLPLHASLPASEQRRVFEPTPHGARKVILATNVAETSLTIPGVGVIVDPGLVKVKRYDHELGIEILSVVPISRSSAVQRAGRAGRVAPGTVYRLYTEGQLAGMEAEQQPEIARTNLANVLLQLKAMGLADLLGFEWLDPPELSALRTAARQLYLLGALDSAGGLTRTGRAMARLPIDPSLARMLLSAADAGVAAAATTICAMSCGEEVFSRPSQAEARDEAQSMRTVFDHPDGDHIALLQLYEQWSAVPPPRRAEWCESRGLRHRVLCTAQSVRAQLVGLLRAAGLSHGGGREQGEDVHGAPTNGRADDSMTAAEVSARCRRALADGYFFHAARRMRGTRVYQTVAPPTQNLFLGSGVAGRAPDERVPSGTSGGGGGGASYRALHAAECVVFSELVWSGRAVMQRASAVEWAWLEPHLPRLRHVDVDVLLGGAASDGGMPREVSSEAASLDGTDAGAKLVGAQVAERRNDRDAVAAARRRYEERKRQRG